jgi:uncharacterized alkaline shock family protein YloU
LSRKNKKRSSLRHTCFKIKIKLFAAVIFGAQMTTSVLKGFYNNDFRWATLAVYAILFIFLAIFTLEFAIFGWLLYRCITDQEEKVNEYYEKAAVQQGALAAALAIGNQPNNANDLSIEGDSSPVKLEKNSRSKQYEYHETDGASPLKKNQQTPTPKDTPVRSSANKKKTVIFHPEPAYMSEDGSANIQISPFTALTPSIKDDLHSGSPSLRRIPLKQHSSVPMGLMAHASGSSRKLTVFTPKHKPDIENKIKGIVERHQKHIEPVQLMGTEESNIAAEISVIVDDEAEISWCYNEVQEMVDFEEEQRRKDLKREEARKEVAEIRQMKEVMRQMSVEKNTKKKQASELFYLKLLEDPAYLKHHQEITKNDKIIIRKILGLTVIGIVLEILFALIFLMVFGGSSLQNPTGMILAMWGTGILEILAIISIFVLFSIVQTQEKENLRIIMTIGQNRNRINRLYGFMLPPKLRQEEGKKKLEKSINQMTAKYMSTLRSFSR